MSEPALVVTDLCAGYGDVAVLEDVSVTVGTGMLVSVLGANGAGKTTLLRAISGMVRPTAGSVMLEGKRIDGRPPYALAKLGIGHVPSGRELFPEMTVDENLGLGAYRVQRARADELRARVFELFPALPDIRRRQAGALSGGQAQMLAIGRALMTDPSLLLLDEPSTGLAPNLVASLLETLGQLLEGGGLSVLLVEQNASIALRLAETVYVLQHGRCVLDGRPKDLEQGKLVSAYLG